MSDTWWSCHPGTEANHQASTPAGTRAARGTHITAWQRLDGEQLLG